MSEEILVAQADVEGGLTGDELEAAMSFQMQCSIGETLAKAANLLGGTGGWADREIEREYGVIRGSAVDDPNKWCFDHACGAEQFETDVRWLHAFLSERSRNVLDGVAKAGHSGDRAP